MKLKLFAGIVAASALLAVGTAAADPITTTGLTVVVGDKTFSNFTCSITSGGTTSPTLCSQINVAGIFTDPLGLRFSSGFTASSSSFIDVLIGYDVTVTDPALKISAIDLAFNGTQLFGLPIVSVTETAFSGATIVGNTFVAAPSPLQATVALSGTFSSLSISKDIVISSGVGEAGTISFIDQRFHQVPEPGTLGLAGLVLLALGASRIKRNKV